jgi:ABC-type glycerol-3-phosphate transport system permease component
MHVTLPLMAGMYLVCTMLSTIWALGDFNAVRFISGGGPALSTHVLATPGHPQRLRTGRSQAGMATVLTALPLLIPLVILLMRQLAAQRGDRYDRATPGPRDRSIGVWLLSAVLLIWTLLPIYNILRVSAAGKGGSAQHLRLPARAQPACVQRRVPPGLLAAGDVLEPDGQQLSILASFVALLTLAIGSLTSFTISRMRIRSGWMLTNAALLTYVIPMSFLAIPFYGIMGKYGLTNNPLAVIAVE